MCFYGARRKTSTPPPPPLPTIFARHFVAAIIFCFCVFFSLSLCSFSPRREAPLSRYRRRGPLRCIGQARLVLRLGFCRSLVRPLFFILSSKNYREATPLDLSSESPLLSVLRLSGSRRPGKVELGKREEAVSGACGGDACGCASGARLWCRFRPP